MALSAHQRRRRYLTSEALTAGFAPETGAPIARLWILRLLSRGGTKLLKEVGNHTTLALHLGVALEAQPETKDDDFEDLPKPELTPALIRRLLRSAESDPASHALPEPLASNISALAQELGFDHAAKQVLSFCVLLASDNQLEEACNALGSLNDNRSLSNLEHLLNLPLPLVRQSGLLRMDHSNCRNSHPATLPPPCASTALPRWSMRRHCCAPWSHTLSRPAAAWTPAPNPATHRHAAPASGCKKCACCPPANPCCRPK